MPSKVFALSVAATILGIWAAQADVTISNKPTNNVTCTSGACTVTARHANLNATELMTMLASSDVSMASGRGAGNIIVKAPVSWSSTHQLALDAFDSLRVESPITVMGTAGMTITTNHHGFTSLLVTGKKGHIEFWDVNSSLVINGAAYRLAADIASLSAGIAAHLFDNFALANSYDAAPDGTYTRAPIEAVFQGNLDGLGNTIRNLKIKVGNGNLLVGLFDATHGPVANLHFARVKIEVGRGITAGGLAGYCGRDVTNVDVTGNIKGGAFSLTGGLCGKTSASITASHASVDIAGVGGQAISGGLVGTVLGDGGGSISNSYATGRVAANQDWIVGGLVGENGGTIASSYATGTVITGDGGFAGGLIGVNSEPVTNSYATGFAGGGVNSTVGGFIGENGGPVSDSYSSGGVVSGSGNAVGGFIGTDIGSSDLTDTYFDITTSGQSHGVGNNTAYPGITGLTTEEFQAGLPAGLDAAIWAENPDVNGGLPYLLALPPG